MTPEIVKFIVDAGTTAVLLVLLYMQRIDTNKKDDKFFNLFDKMTDKFEKLITGQATLASAIDNNSKTLIAMFDEIKELIKEMNKGDSKQ